MELIQRGAEYSNDDLVLTQRGNKYESDNITVTLTANKAIVDGAIGGGGYGTDWRSLTSDDTILHFDESLKNVTFILGWVNGTGSNNILDINKAYVEYDGVKYGCSRPNERDLGFVHLPSIIGDVKVHMSNTGWGAHLVLVYNN